MTGNTTREILLVKSMFHLRVCEKVCHLHVAAATGRVARCAVLFVPDLDALVKLVAADEDAAGILDRDEESVPHTLNVAVRIKGHSQEARTGREGTFLFEGLTGKRYRVQVARDRSALTQTLVHPFDPGAEELVIPLPPECLTLTGEVRDAHGAIPGAEVELKRFGLVGRVTTDAEGRFRVSGLDDQAAYQVVASAACSRTGASLAGRADAWGFGTAVVHLEPRK